MYYIAKCASCKKVFLYAKDAYNNRVEEPKCSCGELLIVGNKEVSLLEIIL